MTYKSNYTIVLMVEEKKLREKELELATSLKEKQKILDKIQEEEEKVRLFYSYLEENNHVSSEFLSSQMDYTYREELKELLVQTEKTIQLKQTEYLALKEKKKVIEELDEKEKKQYNEELKKKEQKKIIGVKTLLRMNELNGGDDT